MEYNQSSSLVLQWVKGHTDIRGNVIADRAANKAHMNNRTELTALSDTELISILRTKFIDYWTEYWNATTATSGKGIYLKQFRDTVKYNKVIFDIKHRRAQVLMNRFRIGHIGVRSYLNRFHMSEEKTCENPICSQEDEEETIEHFILTCPKYSTHREDLKQKLISIGVMNFDLKVLLLNETSYKLRHEGILKHFLDFLYKIERVATYFQKLGSKSLKLV